MANACGVDFGTSNSTVGVVRPGHRALLALEDDKLTLPSAVFFNAEDEQVSYGRAALANYLAGYEGRLMRSLKSLLGTGLIDGQTEVLGRALPFRMLLGQFIGELKRRAETASGQSFQHAVIGRPVFFVDGDAKADQLAEQTLSDIAGAAGFRQVAFQFEPIAAAFDYESRIDREEVVLVADIGGGTSDFSLIRLSPQRARRIDRRSDILASGGVHIGGTDFDKYLSLTSVMPLLGLGSRLNNDSEVPSSYYFNLATWHTINLAYTQKTWLQLKDIYRDARERPKLDRLLDVIRERSGHWLAIQVEEGKIALSEAESVILNLDRLAPREELTLTRDAFDASIARLMGTVESTVADLLRTAGVDASAVDTVFFTGGSSGVGSLRQRIARLVPDARQVEGDLFGSIGAGLALDALRRFG
ncbi:Hsp70 family protein [Actimicrobium sp. CCC2.4]|uniref:Hsp70 family protein n=1 Tax=Actimicrobium sp. CCC2.4 TaxID=3048606 RepID=UPI002AC9D419|nr:Hsp70 family protein [Actimicrobium sp. CCC2.4]MEB0135968.1 Hsp70 family protein [Actimicrobium sp. CCC2.4]WPX32631.1 Hsp70 family protein [Actimicrobium sp. CCC2.4]